MTRVVVIGAGIAGLTAALRLRRAGAEVTLLTKGIGGLQLGQGTVDILGYAPERVERPLERLASYAAEHPEHPYAHLDADAVRAGAAFFAELAGPELVEGDPERNVALPTAVGALRPTALFAPSMAAGVLTDGSHVAIVGPRQLKDFHPELIAGNLARTDLPGGGRAQVRSVSISIEPRRGEADPTGLVFARAVDDPGFRARLVNALRAVVRDGEVIGFPAVLGAQDVAAWRDVATRVGAPIFEIPLPPPSVPGWRLNERLTALAKQERVRVVLGSRVVGFQAERDRVTSVTLKQAGRDRAYPADAFVLAPGGFESGALELDSYGHVREAVFGLPLVGTEGTLVHGDYWGDPQPLFKVGVAVDPAQRVVGPGGEPVYANLHAAGGILAGATRWQEKSGEGIALAGAVKAADAIMGAAGAERGDEQ